MIWTLEKAVNLARSIKFWHSETQPGIFHPEIYAGTTFYVPDGALEHHPEFATERIFLKFELERRIQSFGRTIYISVVAHYHDERKSAVLYRTGEHSKRGLPVRELFLDARKANKYNTILDRLLPIPD